MANRGNKDLNELLKTLSPELNDSEYVFCTFNNGKYGDYAHLNPIASFEEKEGLTLVITSFMAKKNKIESSNPMKCITLNVYSDLEAIGLTAAISKILANHGISANIFAGFFHDHVFVQKDKAYQAIKLLTQLQLKHSKL